jgi:hypothetical protein
MDQPGDSSKATLTRQGRAQATDEDDEDDESRGASVVRIEARSRTVMFPQTTGALTAALHS